MVPAENLTKFFYYIKFKRRAITKMLQLMTASGEVIPADDEDLYTIMRGHDSYDWIIMLDENKRKIWKKYVYTQEDDVFLDPPEIYEDMDVDMEKIVQEKVKGAKTVRFLPNDDSEKPKSKKKKVASTNEIEKPLSPYHSFIQEFLRTNPNITYKERMAAANSAWKDFKATLHINSKS